MLRAFCAPKVVLGTKPDEVAGVPHLEMGADAYLAAALDLRMLLARVRAMTKRKECIEVELKWRQDSGAAEARTLRAGERLRGDCPGRDRTVGLR